MAKKEHGERELSPEEKLAKSREILTLLDDVNCLTKMEILTVLSGGMIRHLAMDHSDSENKQDIALEITKAHVGRLIEVIAPQNMPGDLSELVPEVFH